LVTPVVGGELVRTAPVLASSVFAAASAIVLFKLVVSAGGTFKVVETAVSPLSLALF
jgi:hypothetical protein